MALTKTSTLKMSFKGVKPGGAGGVYFEFGTYRASVEDMKIIDKRKGGELFVIDFSIIESNNPKRPAGSRCAWTMNKTQDNMGMILTNLQAVAGIEPGTEMDEATTEEFDTLVNNYLTNNGAKGNVVRVEAYPAKMKNGVDIVAVKMYPPETQAAA